MLGKLEMVEFILSSDQHCAASVWVLHLMLISGYALVAI